MRSESRIRPLSRSAVKANKELRIPMGLSESLTTTTYPFIILVETKRCEKSTRTEFDFILV